MFPAPVSFNLTNAGNDTTTIDSIVFDQSVFSISGTLPLQIPPYGNLNLEVVFTADLDTSFLGTMDIFSNADSNSVLQITLTGTATPPPTVDVTPLSLSVTATGAKDTLLDSLSISNSGVDPLQFKFTGDQGDGTVLINEIRTSSSEYVEIWNRGPEIDIGGWSLHWSGGSYTFPVNAKIKRNSFVMLYEGSGTNQDSIFYMEQSVSWGYSNFAYLYLVKEDSTGVDFIRSTVSSVVPPAGTNWVGPGVNTPNSYYLYRIQNEDTDSASDWASTYYSSPGFLNQGQITINRLPEWISIIPDSGSVLGGTVFDKEIKFLSGILEPGVYQDTLLILHNAPLVAEPVSIAVEMTVDTQNILSLRNDSLFYDTIWYGFDHLKTFSVENQGNFKTVVDSIVVQHPEFRVLDTLPISVGAFDTLNFTLENMPSDLGEDTAQVLIYSNALDNPILTLNVFSNTVNPPSISLNPSSISDTGTQYDTLNHGITISNTGGDMLQWSLTENNLGIVPFEIDSLIPGVQARNYVPTTTDLYCSYWSDAGNNTFDRFYSPRIYISSSSQSVCMNPGEYLYTVNGYNIQVKNEIVGNHILRMQMRPAPGETSIRSDVIISMNGDMGTDGNQINPMDTIQVGNTKIPLYINQANNYPNSSPRTVFALIPHKKEDVSKVSYSISYDDISIYAANLTLPATMYVIPSYHTLENIKEWFAWELGGPMPDWLEVDTGNGLVPPGENGILNVSLNPEGVPAGHYMDTLEMNHNDPNQTSPLLFPISWTVEENREISAGSDSIISFDSLWIPLSQIHEFFLYNKGNVSLRVDSLVIGHGDFTLSRSTFNIPAFDSVLLGVTFTPSSTGDKNSTLTIYSDADNQSALSIPIFAHGVVPPGITPFPESLVVSSSGLNDTLTENLSIYNSGEGQLAFGVNGIIQPQPIVINEISVYLTKFVEIWNRGPDQDVSNWKLEWNGGSYTIPEGTILYENSFTALRGDTGINNDSILYIGFNPNWQVYNSFHLSLIKEDGTGVDFFKTIQSTEDPPAGTNWHGQGVFTSSYGHYRNKVEDTDSASDWSTGYYNNSTYLSQNLGQDTLNVLPPWLSVDKKTVYVPADISQNLNFTFTSLGLTAGIYRDTLLLNHNSPGTNTPLKVPVKFNVGSVKRLALSDSAIEYGVQYVDVPKFKTYTLYNSGNDTTFITSTSVTHSVFALKDSLPAGIPPYDSLTVQVVFIADSAREYFDTLTFITDADTLNSQFIILSGAAIPPPKIAVSPLSLSVTAAVSDTVIEDVINISNYGSDGLDFSVVGNGGDGSIVINEFSNYSSHYIELWNRGGERDISDWKLEWSGGSYSFPQGTRIKTHDFIRLVPGVGTNTEFIHYTGIYQYWNTGNPSYVSLVREDGSGVDFVRTSSSSVQPPQGTEWFGLGSYFYYGIFYRNQNTDTDSSSDWSYQSYSVGTPGVLNSGQTSLNLLPSWLQISNAAGRLNADDSADVYFQFNSDSLLAGLYEDTVAVVHNAPLITSPILIPLSFQVDEQKLIITSLDTVDFGTVWIANTETLSLQLSNPGNSPVMISSFTFDHGDFAVVDSAPLVLDPFSDSIISVNYQPSDAGGDLGILTITSDAQNNTAKEIAFHGIGIVPPHITFSPLSYSGTGTQSDTLIDSLVIRNTGGDSLIWQISGIGGGLIPAEIDSAIPGTQLRSYSANHYDLSCNSWSDAGNDAFDGMGPVSVTVGSSSTNICMNEGTYTYSLDGYDFRVRTDFAENHILRIIVEEDSLETSSRSDIDIRLTGNMGSDGGEINLTDTVQVGNVVITLFTNETTNSPNSDPRVVFAVVPSQTEDHEDISFSYPGDNIDLQAIDITLPAVLYIIPSYYQMADIKDWFRMEFGSTGSGRVSLDVNAGSIPPGDSQTVVFTLDPKGILAGDYEDSLNIVHNDPDDSNPQYFPIHWTLLENREISHNGDSLIVFDTLWNPMAQDLILTLTNFGNANISVDSLVLAQGDFDVIGDTSFVIEAFKDYQVRLRFAPLGTGLSNETLHIYSDAMNQPYLQIQLNGEGITPPEIQLSPTEMTQISTSLGDVGQQSILVSNAGQGTLTANVNGTYIKSQIVINEIYNTYQSYIELWNRGSAQDISGWVLNWNGGSYTFPPGTMIFSNSLISVLEGNGSNTSYNHFTNINPMWNQGNPTYVSLVRDDGRGVDFVRSSASSQAPPAGTFWEGDSLAAGNFFARLQNYDTDSSADWTTLTYYSSRGSINSGQSSIDSWPSWLVLDNRMVSVPGGTDTTLNFTFYSNGLRAGVYTDTLKVGHNSPSSANPQLIPVSFTVNSIKYLSIAPESVNFGLKYSGVSYLKSITLYNQGNDTTTISGTVIAEPSFQILTALPIKVPPFGNKEVVLEFTPASASNFEDTLQFVSDADSGNPTLLALTGSAILPPSITIDPASITQTVAGVRDTAVDTLSITNLGSSGLTYIINTDSLPSDIVINEISSANGGYFELWNRGSQRDISGWRLIWEGGSFTFPSNSIISGNSFVLVRSGTGVNNGNTFFLGYYISIGYSNPIYLTLVDSDSAGVDFILRGSSGTPGLGDEWKGPGVGGYYYSVYRNKISDNDTASDWTNSYGSSMGLPNTGQDLENELPDWITLDTQSGILPESSSVSIEIKLNSDSLDAGVWEDTLYIAHNAPLDVSPILLPISFTVEEERLLSSSADSLDAGQVWIGLSQGIPLRLINMGNAEITFSSISIDQGEFQISESAGMVIPPFEDTLVNVTYNPADLGVDVGLLTFLNDSENNPNLVIALRGEGTQGPSYGLTPLGLDTSGSHLDTIKDTLLVSNTGGATLSWSLTNNLQNGLIPAEIDTVIPGSQARIYNTTHYDLYCSYWNDGGNDAFNNLYAPTVTVGGSSGSVCMSVGTHSYVRNGYRFRVRNEFAENHILRMIFEPDSGETSERSDISIRLNGSMGTGNSKTNPVDHVQIADTSIALFSNLPTDYPNGDPRVVFALVPSKVEDLSDVVFSSPYSGYGSITLEATNISLPAALYIIPSYHGIEDIKKWFEMEFNGVLPSWLSLSAQAGNILPGDSQQVELLIDPIRVPAGVYQNELFIHHNDPLNLSPDTFSLRWELLEHREIASSEDTLNFGSIWEGEQKLLSVTLSNSGNAPIAVNSIQFGNSEFSINGGTKDTIPAFGEVTKTVVFSPVDAGNEVTYMTVFSDADNNSALQIVLNGTGITPPQITVNPNSVSLTSTKLVDTLNQEITLSNPGDGVLNFSINGVTGNGAILINEISGTDPEFIELWNRGGNTDISGWTLAWDGYNFTFPQGSIFRKNSFITVRENSGTNNDSTYYFGFGAAWGGNNPSFVSLTRENGTGVDFVKTLYSSAIPPAGVNWFGPGVNYNSSTLYRISNADSDSAVDWTSNYSNTRYGLNPGQNKQGILPTWLNLEYDSGILPGHLDTTMILTLLSAGLPAGTHTDTLQIQHNSPVSNNPVQIPVSFRISAFKYLALFDTSLDFGSQFANSNTQRSFLINNIGNDTVTISRLESDNNVFHLIDSLPIEVPPFSGKYLTLNFNPDGVGTFNGTFEIESDADSGALLNLTVTGIGTPPPEIKVSPQSLTWELTGVDTEQDTLMISNIGQVQLTGQVSTSLPSWLNIPGRFFSINPGDSTPIAMSVSSAGLNSGTYSDTLEIFHNATNESSPFYVGVQLTVNPEAVIALSHDTLFFGEIWAGTDTLLPLRISNNGNTSLSVDSLISSNLEFNPLYDSGFVLGAFSDTTLFVQFAPTDTGMENGTLSVYSNADNIQILTVALNGIGTPPPIIDVTPLQLTVNLTGSNDSTFDTVYISNTGADGLDYQIIGNEADGTIVINEVGRSGYDYVEIWNRGPARDISGWTLTWDDSSYTFPPGSQIGTNSFVLLLDNSYSGNDSLFSSGFPFNWSYGALSYLALTQADGTGVDFVKFDSSAQVPPNGTSWTGPGAPFLYSVIYRNQNEDTDSNSDWTSNSYTRTYFRLNFGQTSLASLPSWLSASTQIGNANNGEIDTILFRFDSHNLNAGNYLDTVLVLHNAPQVSNPIPVEINLTVGQEPLIQSPTSSLNFGRVWIGLSDSLNIQLINSGNFETNITSISTNLAEFTIPGDTAFTIPAFSDTIFKVLYTPADEGIDSGDVTIVSDASKDSIITISIIGEGAFGPELDLAPASLSFSGGPEDTLRDTVLIVNNGAETLNWSVNGQSGGRLVSREIDSLIPGVQDRAFTASHDISCGSWGDGGNDAFDGLSAPIVSAGAANVSVCMDEGEYNYTLDGYDFRVRNDFAENHILRMIFEPQPHEVSNRSDFSIQLNGNMGSDGSEINPTDTIQIGSAVITLYMNQTTSYPSSDPRVVFALVPSNSNDLNNVTFSAPGDNISLSGTNIRLPASMYVIPSYYPVENIKDWFRMEFGEVLPKWLNIDVAGGNILAGDSSQIEVTVVPNNIPAGNYVENLVFSHNASNHLGPVDFPITYNLTGTGQIASTSDSLFFGSTWELTQVVRYLTLSNSGNDTVAIDSIGFDNSEFDVEGNYANKIPPFEQINIPITFNPADPGQETGTVIIYNSSDNNNALSVYMDGLGTAAPQISVNPIAVLDSTDNLLDTLNQNLTISNVGGDLLTFTVQGSNFGKPIVINEINSVGIDFIEIWNRGPEIDISGWILEWNGGSFYTFPDSSFLPSNSFAVVREGVGSNSSDTYFSQTSLYFDYQFPRFVRLMKPDSGGVDFVVTQGYSAQPGQGDSWKGPGVYFNAANLYRSEIIDGDTLTDWSIGYSYTRGRKNLGQDTAKALAPWMDLNHYSGNVNSGADTIFVLSLISAGLNSGLYEDTLNFFNNSPFSNEPLKVPVQFFVGGVKHLADIDTSVNFGTVVTGDTLSYNLSLKNLGNDTLTIDSAVLDQALFFVRDDLPLQVLPGTTHDLEIVFAPSTNVLVTGNLTLYTDADSNPIRSLSLRGLGFTPAQFAAFPESLSISLRENQNNLDSFNIGNSGSTQLTVTLLGNPAGWVSPQFTTLNVSAGNNSMALVSFNSTGLLGGLYRDTLVLVHNGLNVPSPYLLPITLRVQGNRAPVFNSTAGLNATEDQEYTYSPSAGDPDGDGVTYQLIQGPSGMTLSNGRLSWTPGEGVLTSGEVIISATDDYTPFAADSQHFTITVTPVNDPPTITSQAPQNNPTEDSLWVFSPEASDIEGDGFHWVLENSPAGMTIDAGTGLVQWTPTGNDSLANNILIIVQDENDAALADTLSFSLQVNLVNDAPQITSPARTGAVETILYEYTPTVEDEEGHSITWSLVNAPAGMQLDTSTGKISWIPQIGETTSGLIKLIASDNGTPSESVEQEFEILVTKRDFGSVTFAGLPDSARVYIGATPDWMGTEKLMGNGTLINLVPQIIGFTIISNGNRNFGINVLVEPNKDTLVTIGLRNPVPIILSQNDTLKSNGSPLTAGSNLFTSLADIDRDGDMDLIMGKESSNLEIFLQSSGDFQLESTLAMGTTGLQTIRIMDWNGDGYLDLIGGYYSGTIVAHFGDSAFSTFSNDTIISIANGLTGFVLTHLNSDTVPDLIIGYENGDLTRHVSENGSWTESDITITNSHVQENLSPILIDVDGDGKQDIISGTLSGNVVWFKALNSDYQYQGLVNNSGIPFGTGPNSTLSTGMQEHGLNHILVTDEGGVLHWLKGYIKGDLDRNGKVEFKDYMLFIQAWNTTEGDTDYNPMANLILNSNSQIIDFKDFMEFVKNWEMEE